MYASNQVHIRYFLLEYILWLECVKTGKDNYCDSGLDSIESPGILIIIDGPEHDGLSQVYSHLSSYHVGSHVPAYP